MPVSGESSAPRRRARHDELPFSPAAKWVIKATMESRARAPGFLIRFLAAGLLALLGPGCTSARRVETVDDLVEQARIGAVRAGAMIAAAGALPEGMEQRRRGQRQLDLAREALDEILAASPSHARALDVRGLVAALGDRPYEAASFYRRAHAAGATSEASREHFRLAAEELKRLVSAGAGREGEALERSIRHHETAVVALAGRMPPEILPEPVAGIVLDMLCDRADLLLLAGRLDEAEQAYRETLDLAPRTARCYEGLGYVARQQVRPWRAAREFKRALAIDPGAVAALAGLCELLLKQGRPEAAARYAERLRGLAPATDS
ncbi:MAG: tetratricopeptide repeat protein [Planctomycetes bacterium]|nr:tetratricopeptide repeat protein [Planctomycetota bacterium]